MKIVLSTLLLIFNLSIYAQNSNLDICLKHIDSAYNTYEDQPELAKAYLDSIPEPVELNMKGHLADYYRLKVLLSDKLNNGAELFHNSLLALKYAKDENNFDIAGLSSIELFYNTYLSKQDSTAFTYLKDAESYYKKGNNINGLAEVKQMYAYIELHKKNYAKSNALILKHLSEYKSIKDDGYYYMYALFMLSSNYIHQGDLKKSHTYFQRLNALEKDSTISKYLYDVHKVSITLCIAEYHLDKIRLDSTMYYLKKAEAERYAMNTSDIELYFNIYKSYYEQIDDLVGKSNYIDSLANFQDKLLEKNMTASLNINESLIKSENLLTNESTKKIFNRNLAIILSLVLLVFLVVVTINYKKFKNSIEGYMSREKNSQHLKSNNEKLKVKVVGLEQYILKVKDEVKVISTVSEPLELRKNIKELYKDIHLKSATELTNGESHLDLINDLNAEFFNEIKSVYPQLNDSEIIICYYIFTGFKNKEIASFLNVSIRSVESTRYRITKKLELDSNLTNLADHLQNTFN
ncbi:helix-turn-helix transcriptional regulator [Psychroserpens luteus]|uniref:Helix-turn-helix transcriptional regulator n=1 Tax=Psychroserpens luteus TaxID=1434066 RepID=A0ABW5ZSP2_9FLAO|nr:LuxR C-terminal-related transcriptional regulator [Psychroserpens luteus]